MEKNGTQSQVEGSGKDKLGKYFPWNVEMDHALAAILTDQMNAGNKGDGGWKPTAYNAAVKTLNEKFNISLSKDNVKNRLKVWKTHYSVVSEILRHSGFAWDNTKNMVSVDDDNVWDAHVQSHPEAKKYRYKVIDNWEDIVMLCGKDRATGEGAETATDAEEVIGLEEANDTDWATGTISLDDIGAGDALNSPNMIRNSHVRARSSSTSVNPPSMKKSRTKDALASAVAVVATSLKEYMTSAEKKLDPKEVYEEVYMVPDLDEIDRLRACKWFIDDEKSFVMLKCLPVEKRKSWIMLTVTGSSV